MSDVILRATARRWEANDFPGWVEVTIADAAGRSHRIVEKVPVLSAADITPSTMFPVELWISAEYDRMEGNDVVVRLAGGITTEEGLDGLSVAAEDVRWL